MVRLAPRGQTSQNLGVATPDVTLLRTGHPVKTRIATISQTSVIVLGLDLHPMGLYSAVQGLDSGS